MCDVINQYRIGGDGFDDITYYGECSKCGCEVSRSKYGRDEDCPKCGEWLDWSKYERWD